MRADGAAQFDDYDEQLNWVLNARADTLYDLDRNDEARVAFRLAIETGEDGARNVSQAINFASRLVGEGRPLEALDALSEVGNASPYGDMWVAAERACASEQLGDRAVRDTALAFLREHEEDNPSARIRGFICMNDLDGAAATIIHRLQDPDDRTEALVALQRYRERAHAGTPQSRLIQQRYDAVRDRPDVQAAIAAVGRIEDVPLYGTD